MSGRVKIKIKDKKPKIDVFKVIENQFKNMNELRDLIDMDPRKGLVRIRDGAGFREVERGGDEAGPVGIMAVGACTEASTITLPDYRWIIVAVNKIYGFINIVYRITVFFVIYITYTYILLVI